MSTGTLVRVPDIATNEIIVKKSAQPENVEGEEVKLWGREWKALHSL